MDDAKKSCWECIHCKGWYYPSTREDPEESGWECKLTDTPYWLEEESFGDCGDAEIAIAYASKCSYYQ